MDAGERSKIRREYQDRENEAGGGKTMRNSLGKRIIAVLLCLVVFAGSELTGLTNIVGDLFAAEEQEFEAQEADVQTEEIEVEESSEAPEEPEAPAPEEPEVPESVETPEVLETPAPEISSEPETSDSETSEEAEASDSDTPSETKTSTPDDTEVSDDAEGNKNEEASEDVSDAPTASEGIDIEIKDTAGNASEDTEDTNQTDLPDVEEAGNPSSSEDIDSEQSADTEEAEEVTDTEEPADTDAAFEEEDSKTSEEEEEIWPEYEKDCTSDDGKVTVYVTAEEGVFPEHTELVVKAITPQDVEALEADDEVSEEELQEAKVIQEKYEAVQQELEESIAEDETKAIAGFLAYDISFWTEIEDEETGETKRVEIEPNGEVQVVMESEDGLLPEELTDEEKISEITLVHMKKTEEGLEAKTFSDASIETAGEIAVEVKTIEFCSDEFSVYTVVWTKEDGLQELEYVDDELKIIVREKEKGSIPKGAVLDVVPLSEEKEETKEQYQEIEKKLQDSAQEEAYEVAGFLAYRFSLSDQNNVPMPLQGEVEVSMEYKEAIIPAGVTEQRANIAMAMIDPEVTEEKTEEDTADNLVEEENPATLDVTETQAIRSANFTADSLEPTVAMVWRTQSVTITSIEIVDDIINSGNLTVKIDDTAKAQIDQMIADAKAEAEANGVLFEPNKVFHYAWYKSVNGGEYQEVQPKGSNYNLADDGSWLNVVLDEGALNDNQSSVVYEVRAVINEVKQVATDNSKAYYSVPYWNELRNGSFEEPVVTNSNGIGKFENGTEKLIWKTTSPGQGEYKGQDIEIVNVSNGRIDEEYAWPKDSPVEAVEGVQFAELNCEAIGALYQDVLTLPGEELNYWLSHRARYSKLLTQTYAINEMYVVIMPTKLAKSGLHDEEDEIDTYEEVEELIKLNEKEALPGVMVEKYGNFERVQLEGGNKWHDYSGTYVPEEYMSRFFFVAGSKNSTNDIRRGNFLDNVGFSQKLPPADPGTFDLQITKTIEGFSFDLTNISEDEKSEKIQEKINDEIGGLSFKVTAIRESGPENTKIPLNNAEVKITDSGWIWKENTDGTYTGTYKFQSQDISPGTQYIYSIIEENKENVSYDCVDSLEIVGGTIQEGGTSTLLGEKSAVTFKFTNTYSLKKSNLTIRKGWNDADNMYETRPTTATILVETLEGEKWIPYVTDGHPDGEYTLTASEGSDSWNCSLEVLPTAQYRFKVLDPDSHYTSPVEQVLESGQKEITLTSTLNWKMLKQSSIATGPSGDYPLLENAEFELQDSDSVMAIGKSDENGVITWSSENNTDVFELESLNGTYTITETKAPEGHSLAESDWQITFKNGIPKAVEGSYEVTDTGVNLIFKNTPLYELPSTGGDGIYVYMISGTLLMLASMLILYKRKLAGRC